MVKLISDRLTAANNKIDDLQKRLMILEEMNDDGDEVEDDPEETEEETEDGSTSEGN